MPQTRILALTKSTGGIALYNKRLLGALDREQFASHTLCLSEGAAGYAAALAELGLSCEAFPMSRYRIDPAGDARVLYRVLAAARERQSDVLICHGSKAGFIGRVVGRMTGIPAVYRQASLPFLSRVQGRWAPLYWAIEYAARRLGGHIVTLTEQARRETLAKRLADPARISVIRTGVDTARFRPLGIRDSVVAELGFDPGRPVVGWIGRFEPQKAPLDYVEAVRQVAQRHPDAQFAICGEGRLRGEIVARIMASGLGRRLRLLPWQPDPARTLQAFDVYVLTSHWEGMPLTLLEAMASGCAAVSTDVDGCAEAIEDGVSGSLVPAGQPDAAARGIDALLAAPERRASVARAARQRAVELFDERRMVAEWTALLGRLAARPSAAPAVGAAHAH